MEDMNSTKKQARIAGLLYLLLSITGIFSILYIPSTLFVVGDATATGNNIASSELLFRFGIFTSLVSNVIFIFLAVALYRLLKEINHRQALLMVILVLVAVSTGFLNTLSQTAALIMLSGADFLSVFEKSELDALAYAFLRLHNQGLQAISIFWGLWLFPFGLLVYQSRFILLLVAGSAYLLGSFTAIVLPQINAAIYPFLMILELGELLMVFWLLIVGAKTQALD
jgi:hypothetical protein